MSEQMETRQDLPEAAAERIELYLPKWVEMLPEDHDIKKTLVALVREELEQRSRPEGETERGTLPTRLRELPFLQSVTEIRHPEEETPGAFRLQLVFREELYYERISEMAGIPIDGEYQLMALIRELSGLRAEYEEIHQAMESVRQTGYGVVLPRREEIAWEEPELTHNNNRYGVRLKAVSPSIHLLKADIASEISPIVGTRQQAEDLIAYLQAGKTEESGVWEINIFGKSVEQLMEEGIAARLSQLDEKKREKLQKIIGRILDENHHGMICVII